MSTWRSCSCTTRRFFVRRSSAAPHARRSACECNARSPAPEVHPSFLGVHAVVALHVAPAVESRYAERRQPREERTMATSRHAPPKFETVLYEKRGPICFITLNRPEKLNAANDQLVEEVIDALFEFDADPDLQVAILAGAGRAFCSGADVQQRQLRPPEE